MLYGITWENNHTLHQLKYNSIIIVYNKLFDQKVVPIQHQFMCQLSVAGETPKIKSNVYHNLNAVK